MWPTACIIRDTLLRVFSVAFFIILQKTETFKYSSTVEWIHKWQSIHTIEDYTGTYNKRMNPVMIFKIFKHWAAQTLTNQNGRQIKTGTAVQVHTSWIQQRLTLKHIMQSKRIKSPKETRAMTPKPNRGRRLKYWVSEKNKCLPCDIGGVCDHLWTYKVELLH